MLDFQNVTFQYNQDDCKMFENLSFHVDKGDFISLIGASGCGKSTVFRLINKLEVPQEGAILINNKPVADLTQYSGFMPQKDLLFPWRTVGDNLMLPLELKKIPKKQRLEQSKELLHTVGLSEYYDKYPRELSGGMRQRVAFARTLLTGCELLLLDEPFSALDSLTRMELQEWILKQWEHFHRTILLVTHDVEEALFLSNKIFLMNARPVKKLQEFEVPLSYPRSRKQFSDASVIEFKETLIQRLRKDMK